MTRSLAESLAGGSPLVWAADLLAAANEPRTPENLRVVVSWEYAESGAGGGMWNPLNTTQGGYPGETNANSVGVKNYVRREHGIAANARVLHNGFYPNILAALARGDNAQAVIDAIVTSPWGTRHIHLIGPVGPVPVPPAPKPPEDDVLAFPSARKPANKFRGAKVNVAARTIVLEGGAVQVPPGRPTPERPWDCAYARTDGRHGFVIVTAGDLDEYAYELP